MRRKLPGSLSLSKAPTLPAIEDGRFVELSISEWAVETTEGGKLGGCRLSESCRREAIASMP